MVGLATAVAVWIVAHRPFSPAATAVPSVAASTTLPSASATPAVNYPEWNSVPNEALPPKSALAPNTLRVLVVGDSEAKFFGNVMRFRQKTADAFVAQRGVGSCSIHPADDGSSCASNWVTDVAELHPDVTFAILGGGALGDQTCDPGWRARYSRRLAFLLRSIQKDAGRIALALIPYPSERWGGAARLPLTRCFNEELTKVAASEHADTVDLMGHLCPEGICAETSDGWPIRRDGLHFDGPGAHETAEWTLGDLRRIAEMPRVVGP